MNRGHDQQSVATPAQRPHVVDADAIGILSAGGRHHLGTHP